MLISSSIPAGMQAFYEVKSCDSEASTKVMGGVVRNYFLAAEKIQWAYAPSEQDLINNVSLTEANRWADISNILESTTYCNQW